MQVARSGSGRILGDLGVRGWASSPDAAGGRTDRAELFFGSRALLWILAGVGALLRLWQFAGGASLWLDELALSQNILGRPLSRLLFHPLGSWQVAPPGFLLVERVAVVLGGALGLPGHPVSTLRLLPFFGSLAALSLFVRLAERTLDGFARPFAVACFALAPEQIFYSSEVKPYALDVAVALLLWLLALHFRDSPGDLRRAWAIGAAGALAIGLSQPAVLMVGGLGFAFLALAWSRREPRAPVAAILVLWGSAAGAEVLSSLASIAPATRAYMHRYWASSFLPPLSRPGEVLAWLGDAAHAEFTHEALSYKGAFLYMLATAAGLALLWRRRRDLGLLLLGPFAATFLAAVLHQYPFRGRLLAFLIPAVLLPMATGIEALRQALRSRPALRACVLLAACFPPVQTLAANPPVYRMEESPPMLAHVQALRRPGDMVYVYYAAELAVRFYGPAYGLRAGDYILGGCHFPDRRSFLRELDLLRGRKRVWVLFSHALPRLGERQAIVGYLDRIGVRLDAIEIPTHRRTVDDNVFAYLYDLSDPARLAAATAETFPLDAQEGPPNENAGCQGPQRPGPALPGRYGRTSAL